MLVDLMLDVKIIKMEQKVYKQETNKLKKEITETEKIMQVQEEGKWIKKKRSTNYKNRRINGVFVTGLKIDTGKREEVK